MSYEVLVENLRGAAGKYHGAADSLGADGVEISNLNPESFGHVELAAWVEAVAEQCDKATRALHDGATGLADGLEASARFYETTDQGVAGVLQHPLGTGLLTPPYGAPR
jgi:Excreted virulence factor EspC, type VII ESX diderm